MIAESGWFVSATSSECDECGHKTARGERLYHDGGDVVTFSLGHVEKRLCVECAP